MVRRTEKDGAEENLQMVYHSEVRKEERNGFKMAGGSYTALPQSA